MFFISEITAAPHFPHALLPLIAAMVTPDAVISVHVNPEYSAADVEITERDGGISIAISAGVAGC